MKNKMKYFTRDWCSGHLSEQEIEKKQSEYEAYIDTIYDSLSFNLKTLSKYINLHDGIIKKLIIHKNNDQLELNGVFGDLQLGYFNLTIKYIGVITLDIESIKTRFHEKKSIILSDELEKKDHHSYSHRIIFSTEKEIEINFHDIEIHITTSSSQEYQEDPCKMIQLQ